MTLYIKTAQGWKPWLTSIPVTENHNDIQGCHNSEPLDVIREFLDRRVERFLKANAIGNNTEKQAFFRGDSFIEPLFGAFGERL